METTSMDTAVERARHRVEAVREFWGHFWLYAFVNTAFVLIDLVDGSGTDTLLGLDWAYFPLIGWGVFVLAELLSVFWFAGRYGGRWEERKLEQYIALEPRRPSRPGAFATDDDWC